MNGHGERMSAPVSVLFGTSEQVGAGRGLAEVRAGRPVLVTGGASPLLALPVEGLDDARLRAFRAFCAPVRPRLVVTASRARALGLDAEEPVALGLAPGTDAAAILSLVAEAQADHDFVREPAGPAACAAVELVKLARILPAVLVAETAVERVMGVVPPVVALDAAAVGRFRAEADLSLAVAGEAEVPLGCGVRTRFVVFRDAFGDDPVAVIVGRPDPSRPVPVRIHSACMTGDVFGSRRCDCGDQLRLALKRLHEAGGGAILYLPQEGRGLGLANKMRTYRLQDAGLDTVDANTTLGFDDDERDYAIAGRMLRMLGFDRVVLLTNNPAKLDGLARAGIDIAERMPLETPINADNRRYLAAKAERAGHQLRHLLTALAEPSEDDEKAPRLVP